MKKFLLTYWITTAVLFIIFYWDVSPLSEPINTIQTNLTSFLTSMVLPSSMMNGHHIFISSYYSLVIEKACNGMILYLFFLSPIIVFPATIEHKVKWAIGGYLIIVMVNVFRIWLITQFVLKSHNNFSLAHDYLGNILLILTAMFLFIGFVKSRRKKVEKKSKKVLKKVAYA